MSTTITKLPLVQTNKEFMDYLENTIYSPKYEDKEYSTKGRLRELKTYILESDEGFPSLLDTNEMSCKVSDTGLQHMKILRINFANAVYEFFLYVSDKRFFILHTNHKSEDVNRIIDLLTKEQRYTFDNVWFYSDMLKRFSDKSGNSFKGFGASYSDKFLRSTEDIDSDIED